MSSVATTPRRMETFARALDRAIASKVIPRPRTDQLRSAFVATDAQGRSWTIDPEFQRWGRLDGERWFVDNPPPQLLMDSELRTSLEALEAMVARAIVSGADALQAPRNSWFVTPPAESAAMQASTPSRDFEVVPHPAVDRAESPAPERPPSSESMSSRVDAVPEISDPAMKASDVEPVWTVPVMSPELSDHAEPMMRSVETTPAAEPAPSPTVMAPPPMVMAPMPTVMVPMPTVSVPTPTVMATWNSSMASAPAASRVAEVASQVATPIDETVHATAIPDAHRRFARPAIAPVAEVAAATAVMAAAIALTAPDRTPAFAEPPAPVSRRNGNHDHERWVPTSIAPRLMALRPEPRDDRGHVVLCGVLAVLFLALGAWKDDVLGYAAGLLFALLAGTLLVLNHAHSRHE